MLDFAKCLPEQVEAIKAPIDKDLQVVAGAGTGKTEVIAARVVHFLESKLFTPHKVWAISFTNNASKELGERITKLAGGRTGVNVTNLHKMCSGLLREVISEFSDLEDVPKRPFSIMTTAQSKELMSQMRKESQERIAQYDEFEVGEAYSNSQLLQRLSLLKNHGIDVQSDFDYLAERINPASLYVMRKYDQFCVDNTLYDFDDLIFRLGRLLEIDEIADWCASKFECLVIDEFQDISQSQMSVIDVLSRNAHRSVVGDASQAIYGWRGANSEHFENFASGRDVTIVNLSFNFRSHDKILTASNLLNSRSIDDSIVALNAVGSESKARRLTYASEDEENAAIANQIKALIGSGVYSAEDIAVLYRSNKQGTPMSNALQSIGITSNIYGQYSFWERRVIKLVMAFLSFSNNPNDFPSFSYLAKQFLGMKASLVSSLVNEYDFFDAFCTRYPAQYAKLSMVVDSILVCDSVQEQIRFFKLNPGLILDDGHTNEEDISLLDSLVAYSESQSFTTMSEMMDHCSLNGNQEQGKGVHLMTMHASKGKQFKVVFVCSVTNGVFPMQVMTTDALMGEIKLLYVAMTRAKEMLYISHVEGRISRLLEDHEWCFEDWNSAAPNGSFDAEHLLKMQNHEQRMSTLTEDRIKAVKEINDLHKRLMAKRQARYSRV